MPDKPAIAAPVPVPGEFDFQGQTYRFAPFDSVEVITRFEAWMLATAWANLRLSRPHLPREEYQEQEAELRRDITAGLYRWSSPLRRRMLATGDAQKQLMLLQVQAHQPHVGRELFDAVYKDDAAAERIVNLMLETADPNSKPPATGTPTPAATA